MFRFESISLLKVFLLNAVLVILLGLNLLAQAQTEQATPANSIPKYPSFAGIVEPLLPAVVNIYTVKYRKPLGVQQRGLPENPLFEQFNELFETFDLPFNFEDYYSDPKAIALGSGFIIDETGYIVTNYHVVNNADEISVKLNDNTEYTATLIGSDQRTDLALLKIEVKAPLAYVKFGDSSKSSVGEWVIAIGNPLGLGGTVTTGIISSKGRDIDDLSGSFVDNFIQTDAAINSGNSGGPMFNVSGEVIGVNTAIASPSGYNIGIGFAIPSSTAQKIIEQLKKTGKITRGKLDIIIQEISSAIAEGLGLQEKSGVLIIEVIKDGAGEKAGLKAGDVITEFNGQPIKSKRKLQILVSETSINQDVKLKVIREGKTIDLTAKITEVPDGVIEKKGNVGSAQIGKASIERSGITFANLSPDIRQNFNLKDNVKGIIITSIAPNKKHFGLKVGDIVLAVNQKPVNNVELFAKIYDNAAEARKKNIVLLVMNATMNLYIALPIISPDT